MIIPDFKSFMYQISNNCTIFGTSDTQLRRELNADQTQIRRKCIWFPCSTRLLPASYPSSTRVLPVFYPCLYATFLAMNTPPPSQHKHNFQVDFRSLSGALPIPFRSVSDREQVHAATLNLRKRGVVA
jgi:hypothetical protein